MKYSLGRYVYGLAAIGAGICVLVWPDFNNWQSIKAIGDAPHSQILSYVVGIVDILGGLAIGWPRTARAGAVALGSVYLIFSVLAIPAIVERPLVYNGFGNFFEQFSFVAGAAMLYASCAPNASVRSSKWATFGSYAFGVCVLSFALEQFFYLSATASLVPKWIPPDQWFWAIATTVALALGAIALLTGFAALPASRLTTAMLLGFGFLVWLPALIAAPHSLTNWSEGTETLGIAGSAWIVADFLANRRLVKRLADGR